MSLFVKQAKVKHQKQNDDERENAEKYNLSLIKIIKKRNKSVHNC